jgi:hypothetical protein
LVYYILIIVQKRVSNIDPKKVNSELVHRLEGNKKILLYKSQDRNKYSSIDLIYGYLGNHKYVQLLLLKCCKGCIQQSLSISRVVDTQTLVLMGDVDPVVESSC